MVVESRPSATALRVAMRRAAHQLIDRLIVFEDPLALAIIGERRAAIVRAGNPRERSRLGRSLRAFLAARSRYAQEALDAAVGRGVGQYVILGAGLDTSAYRVPHPGLRCFEADHPATQERKRSLLEEAGIPIPATLTFVPLDFETQALADGLGAAGFDSSRPAFFSWLGIVPYLHRESVTATLAMIAALPAESAVVFDYGVAPSSPCVGWDTWSGPRSERGGVCLEPRRPAVRHTGFRFETQREGTVAGNARTTRRYNGLRA